MVRRLHKRKSCWHVIAIPQASIAAPTLTVMQSFEAKKDCFVYRTNYHIAQYPEVSVA